MFEMRVRVVKACKAQLPWCTTGKAMATVVIIPVLGSSAIRGFVVVRKKRKKKSIAPTVIRVESKKQSVSKSKRNKRRS
jgi:predicted DNA binding protein